MRKSSIKMGLISSFIAIGLTACGSNSSKNGSSHKSKTEEIAKRNYVLINYNYPNKVCKSSILKNVLSDLDGEDIVTSIENSDVTCSTYGKVNDGNRCLTQDLGYSNASTCVVGLNRASNSYSSKMTNNKLFLEDIQDVIISNF